MTTYSDVPRFLRLPEVIRVTGYQRSSIYAGMAAGRFPKSVKIGPRAVAWSSDSISAWMAAKIAECDAPNEH